MNFEPDIADYRKVFWKLPQPLAEALEEHFFPPVFRCYFREKDLEKDRRKKMTLENEEQDFGGSVLGKKNLREQYNFDMLPQNPWRKFLPSCSPETPEDSPSETPEDSPFETPGESPFEVHIPGDVVLLIYECLAKYNSHFQKLRRLTGREPFEYTFPDERKPEPFEEHLFEEEGCLLFGEECCSEEYRSEEYLPDEELSEGSEREIDYGSSPESNESEQTEDSLDEYGHQIGMGSFLPKDPRFGKRDRFSFEGWKCHQTEIYWQDTFLEIGIRSGFCGFLLIYYGNSDLEVSYWNKEKYTKETYDDRVTSEYTKKPFSKPWLMRNNTETPQKSFLDLFLNWPRHQLPPFRL